MQAANEHLSYALFQTGRGEIRQCLSRNGKHFLLGPATVALALPLHLEVRRIQQRSRVWRYEGKARVQGTLVAEAEISAMLIAG